MQTGYNKLCDWWSLGVIMYEMLIGKKQNLCKLDKNGISVFMQMRYNGISVFMQMR